MPASIALLFDLDGTLIDSDADIAAAANRARGALGLEPLAIADVRRQVGHGLGYLLQHVIPADLHARLPEAREAFVDWYRAHLLDETRPYPGVDEALAALRGHPLGIVTNKPAMFLDPIVQGLGWGDRFGVVVGGDSLPERKPHPAPLLHALERLGATRDRALYVGDSEVDRETAAAAGVRFLCVGWGRAAPAEAATLARYADLPAFVRSLR
jgi:phosphoglycolate phosphatase